MAISTNDEIAILQGLLAKKEYHMAADDSDYDFDFIPVEVIEERLTELVPVRLGKPLPPKPKVMPSPSGDKTWKTADGKTLLIREMMTDHIKNCINMLNRKYSSAPDPYMYGEPEGDAAQDAFNSEVRHVEFMQDSIKEQIKVFEAELNWRYEQSTAKKAWELERDKAQVVR